MSRFKIGTKVKIKDSIRSKYYRQKPNDIHTVTGVSGHKSYDDRGYLEANEGVTISDNTGGWEGAVIWLFKESLEIVEDAPEESDENFV